MRDFGERGQNYYNMRSGLQRAKKFRASLQNCNTNKLKAKSVSNYVFKFFYFRVIVLSARRSPKRDKNSYEIMAELHASVAGHSGDEHTRYLQCPNN